MITKRLLCAGFTALLAFFGQPLVVTLYAQDFDVIRGRITSDDGDPLDGARVSATSYSTAVTRQSRTDKNGRFTIVFPGSEGRYLISVSSIGYVVKNFEIRRTAEQDILLADAVLGRIQLDPIVVNAPVRGTIGRGSASDVGQTVVSIPGNSLTTAEQGNLAVMAASLPGVLLVTGVDGQMGFSVLGLDPSENSVTINGMTFNPGSIPREAGISSSLVTNPYDVSRGGFSGAQLNVRTSGGSNIVTRGLSLNIFAPQLSWTDRASQAEGRDSTTLSLSGIFGGAFKYNTAYYRFSYQYDRSSSPLRTLVNTSPIGLRSAGVSSDSAQRLNTILGDLGIPAIVGRSPSQSVSDRASVSLALNLTPTTSPTAATYALNLDASWSQNSPVGASTTSVPAFATMRESRQLAAVFRHSIYFKYFLSETNLGVTGSSEVSDPFLTLPSARVRVNSAFDDGTSGVTDLRFGGSTNGGSDSKSVATNFGNSISWFSNNNKHRIKLATELGYSVNSATQSDNYLGTFAFNSISDLEAGLPASFTRQLSLRNTRAARLTNAFSLGDTYRHSPDFQLQFGVRMDGGRYFDKPEFNSAIESEFGVRNDFVPTRVYLSPRVGFSWTIGKAPQVTSFTGAAATPRAIVTGGVAVQQSALGSISSVINNTGLPSAVQSLNCVGNATPIPDWSLYLIDPEIVPAECADGSGGTVFSNSSPNVTLYSRDYRAPRSIRSNLSWSRAILDQRFNLAVTATHSTNLQRSSQIDLNFDPTVRFTLLDESARPVYVNPSSIVERTGSIASRDARISPDFSRVTELRSDLRSESRQLTFRLTPNRFVPIRYFSWRLAYTWQDVREQQRGFSSTVGNPLDIFSARSTNTARHQITYNLGYFFFRKLAVGWNGSITSGRPYTPMIAGDVNGDGYSNDRAFIYNPATTADPALAASMEQLLQHTSPEARSCLLRQMGQLAGRNSCSGRWNVTGDLILRIDAARMRLPSKMSIEFNFENPLGGLDLLLHGSRGLRGWGQGQQNIDGTLLHVRGFDPVANRFKYEVNEQFGTARRTLMKLREPVRMTALVKFDLGPVMEKQQLGQSLREGRSLPGQKRTVGSIKSEGISSIPNPLTAVLRQAALLELTRVQEDSLARLSRRYSVRLDSIWAVASSHIAGLPDDFVLESAWQSYLGARKAALDIMIEIAPLIRNLLNGKQWRKLAMPLANAIDVRYLKAIRNGSGGYIGSPSVGSGSP